MSGRRVKTKVAFAPTALFVKHFPDEVVEQAKEFAKQRWQEKVQGVINEMEQTKTEVAATECKVVHPEVPVEKQFSVDVIQKALAVAFGCGIFVGICAGIIIWKCVRT